MAEENILRRKNSGSPISKGPGKITSTALVVILLSLSMFVWTPSAATSREKAPDNPYWQYIREEHFNSWTLNNMTLTQNGKLTIGQSAEVLLDDFVDLDRVAVQENIEADTDAGEMRQIKFMHHFGGSASDEIFDVITTIDGGYAMVGQTESYGAGSTDVWLVKMDAEGRMEWNKTFGGAEEENGRGLIQNADGSFVIVGKMVDGSSSQAWVIKTDSSGNEIWKKNHGGSGPDMGYDILATADGGYVFAGGRADAGMSGHYDFWLMKLDGSGDQVWTKRFNGPGDSAATDIAYAVIATSDNGYIMVGESSRIVSNNPFADVWMVKTDSSGNKAWDKIFGGGGENIQHYGHDVIECTAGGYLIAAETTVGSYQDAWLIRTDASGTKLWDEKYGGNDGDYALSVAETDDGGFIFTGGTVINVPSTTLWIVRTDGTGNELANVTLGGGVQNEGCSIKPVAGGGFAVGGITYSYGAGDAQGWLIRVSEDTGVLYNRSTLVSTNLLAGLNVTSITDFDYEATVLGGTSIRVQFSQDNATWYDSVGQEGGYEELQSALGSIDLSQLNWSGPNFYYKAVLISEGEFGPTLKFIGVSYGVMLTSGSGISQEIVVEDPGRWMTLDWSADTPAGSTILIQIRNGSGSAELDQKEFSGPSGPDSYYTLTGSEIAAHQNEGSKIQFKVLMDTTDADNIPVLYNLSASFNYMPTLSAAKVSPNDGNQDTVFNFSLSYTDLNGAPPSRIHTVIGGENYSMNATDPMDDDWTDGKDYFMRTKLGVGEHTYWFSTSDGELNYSTAPKLVVVSSEILAKIVVGPAIATLDIGDQQRFSASGYDLENESVPITPGWSVNGGGTIDYTGLFTAETSGTWTVYAKVSDILGTATVVVREEENGSGENGDENETLLHLRSISVLPKKQKIRMGDSLSFNATGVKADGDTMNVSVTWAVNGGGVIDENGTFTAVSPGTWTVYANVSTISGMTIVTVSDGVLDKIVVTPSVSEVDLNESIDFTARGFDEHGLEVDIDPRWDSDGGGTIYGKGVFTPTEIGDWTVYANASGVSGSAKVKAGRIGRIEVTCDADTIEIGGRTQYKIGFNEWTRFTARGFDPEGNEVKFTPRWDVKGNSDFIEQDGTFTGRQNGTWTVTAEFWDVTGYANITVKSGSGTPGDDDIEPTGDDEPEEKEDDFVERVRKKLRESPELIAIIAGAIVVLLIIIMVVSALLKRRRKQSVDEDEDEDELEELDADIVMKPELPGKRKGKSKGKGRRGAGGKTVTRPKKKRTKPKREPKSEKEEEIYDDFMNEWEDLEAVSEHTAWEITDQDLEEERAVKKKRVSGRYGEWEEDDWADWEDDWVVDDEYEDDYEEEEERPVKKGRYSRYCDDDYWLDDEDEEDDYDDDDEYYDEEDYDDEDYEDEYDDDQYEDEDDYQYDDDEYWDKDEGDEEGYSGKDRSRSNKRAKRKKKDISEEWDSFWDEQ